MVARLEGLAVDHEFAPGAEPTVYERLSDVIASVLASEQFALVAVGLIVPAALFVIVRAQIRPRRATRGLPAGGTGAVDVDLGALRRARMPGLEESGDPEAEDPALTPADGRRPRSPHGA